MASPVETPGALTGAQLAELIPLIDGSDSVELKLTVPEPQQRSTVAALGMDPLEAQIRQVFFFDTPGLALDGAGVVVRARRSQGRADDTVVKLRAVVPADLPAELRRSEAFKVEVDALPGGFVCSGSMKGTSDEGEIGSVVAGERPLRKLLSKEQRALFAAHVEGVGFDDLVVLGPIFTLRLRFRPAALERRMVAEMWLYPDGSRILELSTRCAPGDAFQAAAELRAFLAGRNIDISGEQQTKTRKAMEYFTAGPR